MPLQIKVGGTWLATIGGYSPPTFSSTADAGPEQMSWDMTLKATFVHPSIRTGKLVEAKAGPSNVWLGSLSEPVFNDDGTWSFTAIGIGGKGQQFLCLDSVGNATSIPDVAIDQAIARGLPWTRPASLSAAAFANPDDTDSLNYLTALLDAWALSVSKRWFIDPKGQIQAAADPTTPSWYLTPGAARLGRVDEDYASDLFIRYKTSAGQYSTQTVSDLVASADNRSEMAVDATPLGVITSAKATSVGNGMMARGAARYALTQPFTVPASRLTTPGGQPAYLPFVRGGQLVRAQGVRNDQGVPLPYYDFVIGRSEYTDGEPTIQIAAVNQAERSLPDILSVAVGQ